MALICLYFSGLIILLPSSAKAPTQLGWVSFSITLHNKFLDPQPEPTRNSLNLSHFKPYLNEIRGPECQIVIASICSGNEPKLNPTFNFLGPKWLLYASILVDIILLPSSAKAPNQLGWVSFITNLHNHFWILKMGWLSKFDNHPQFQNFDFEKGKLFLVLSAAQKLPGSKKNCSSRG